MGVHVHVCLSEKVVGGSSDSSYLNSSRFLGNYSQMDKPTVVSNIGYSSMFLKAVLSFKKTKQNKIKQWQAVGPTHFLKGSKINLVLSESNS